MVIKILGMDPTGLDPDYKLVQNEGIDPNFLGQNHRVNG